MTKAEANAGEQREPIRVWQWEDVPRDLLPLIDDHDDADWVALVPEYLVNEWIPWLEPHASFGCCDVKEYAVPGGVLRVGHHA